ncbi:hypothetical protein B0T10DRAFT_487236 [Thelonectria olida]|uniref:Uncharacterized protein n=1 Tax=Thelonectria olida TaxID=1576542 RepID=A0A9P8W430_9HYPO|nr:hypothetical protein B0T10DRAFT_487236 [Thelonectria olida]
MCVCDRLGRPCIRDYCCTSMFAWAQWSNQVLSVSQSLLRQDRCSPRPVQNPSHRHCCPSWHVSTLQLPNPSIMMLSCRRMQLRTSQKRSNGLVQRAMGLSRSLHRDPEGRKPSCERFLLSLSTGFAVFVGVRVCLRRLVYLIILVRGLFASVKDLMCGVPASHFPTARLSCSFESARQGFHPQRNDARGTRATCLGMGWPFLFESRIPGRQRTGGGRSGCFRSPQLSFSIIMGGTPAVDVYDHSLQCYIPRGTGLQTICAKRRGLRFARRGRHSYELTKDSFRRRRGFQ